MENIPNLFGGSTLSFTKNPNCAGGVATHAGKEFENYLETILEENVPDYYSIIYQPTYTNHYGLPGKRKDYKLVPNSNMLSADSKTSKLETYMLEAKQLGDCTIVQKLDYEWNNLRAGCYGDNFWLIYDYQRYNNSAIKWVSAITEYCINLKKEVADIGINFEWIDHNDFKEMLCEQLN
tara:strand:- start:191 stop:727 length:537 start_codon:yes stop_codon:yes gene_type:complete